jgi:hypothetical protein
MSNLIVGIEAGSGPTSARKRRRLLWRGLPRRLVRNLKRALETVQRMDAREAARAENNGYVPDLLGKNPGSADDRAIKRLLERCTEALAAQY